MKNEPGKKGNIPRILAWTILLCTLVILIMNAGPAHAGERKVIICHFPPGNPENPHTISVSERALPAHLEHGDFVGGCPTGCQLEPSICDDGDVCTFDVCLPNGQCAYFWVVCT